MEEWDAVITDQIPDQQVGWRSTSGSENSGVIRFTPIGADRTRVTAVIGYEPEGIVEQVGDKLGVVESRVKGDLERFKEFIESRGSETGAWRGEIQAELSRAARATSSPLSSPSSQLSWNRETTARLSGGRPLLMLTFAGSRPGDGPTSRRR